MFMLNKASEIAWQESITSLSDEKFFEIMRLYLGKIKTPYNKQRLVEQLVSFLKNPNNCKSIISLLDVFDIKMISAIGFIKNPTEELLIDFFSNDYPVNEIFHEISNLQERLLIFAEKDQYSEKQHFYINPFVQDILLPFINLTNLLQEEKLVYFSMEDSFSISPEFLAALISFLKVKGCSFKNDGNLRKSDLTKIAEIFPNHEKCVELLIRSFFNLGLLSEGEKTFEIDEEKLLLFADLSFSFQMAMICTAACSRLGREGLKKESQLILNVLSSIPDTGYSISGIKKLAFLCSSGLSASSSSSKSRFSKILEAARQEKSMLSDHSGPLIDKMIDSAIEFGLLQLAGKNENGINVYKANIKKDNDVNINGIPKILNIDSTYTVSLMPGLSFKQLLPLTNFLNIKRYGIVSEYEITRQSVTASFDKGWNPQMIFGELEKHSNYAIPQNLSISIEDWYNTYLSARIYQGYVLKVTESNISLVENNPRIKKYIKEKLSDGIYLLNLPINADISIFMEDSGLEFLGKIKNSVEKSERISFPLLMPGQPLEINNEIKGTEINYSKGNEILSILKNTLKEMNVDEHQKESLAYRIKNRLIISKEHLLNTSVKTEILEADGMDYSGKVFLLEAAIKCKDKVELTLPDYGKPDYFYTVVGYPVYLTRQPGDAILRFETIYTEDVQNILVSRITHVKRIRF